MRTLKIRLPRIGTRRVPQQCRGVTYFLDEFGGAGFCEAFYNGVAGLSISHGDSNFNEFVISQCTIEFNLNAFG